MASDQSEDIKQNTDDAIEADTTAPAACAPEADASRNDESADVASPSDADEGADADEEADEAFGNPGLSVATAIFGIVGVILALFVSWILSIVAGIVAIVLGTMAKRQNAPYPRMITAGKVLGFICVVANTVMAVGYVLYLMQLGIL